MGTHCTLLSFSCVRLNHYCWHRGLLLPFGQYQGRDSVCLLVCFGCVCVSTEGEVKAMYRHGDEEQRLTAISPNHLEVRDTVRSEWLHHQTNTHAYTHTYVSAPRAPVARWSALAFCALAGEDVGGGLMWVKVGVGGEEVCSVQHTRSCQVLLPRRRSSTCVARSPLNIHTLTRTWALRRLSTTCSKHVSAFKGSSHTHTHTPLPTHTNAHLQKQTQHAK